MSTDHLTEIHARLLLDHQAIEARCDAVRQWTRETFLRQGAEPPDRAAVTRLAHATLHALDQLRERLPIEASLIGGFQRLTAAEAALHTNLQQLLADQAELKAQLRDVQQKVAEQQTELPTVPGLH